MMTHDDEMDAYYDKWLNERAAVKRLRDQNARLCNSLVGILRASDARRREKDGERHQYYYHTANAALEGNDGPQNRTEPKQESATPIATPGSDGL